MNNITYLTDNNEVTDRKHASKFESYLVDKNGKIIGRNYGSLNSSYQKPKIDFARGNNA